MGPIHEQYMMHCLLQKSQHLRLLFIEQCMNSNRILPKQVKKKKKKEEQKEQKRKTQTGSKRRRVSKLALEEHTQKKKKKVRIIIFLTSILKFKSRVVRLTQLPLFL